MDFCFERPSQSQSQADNGVIERRLPNLLHISSIRSM
jgi:hypothetical protein